MNLWRKPLEQEGSKKVGGAGGTRTLYLFNAIEALSRLSYSPTDDVIAIARLCFSTTSDPIVLGALSRLSFSPKERTRGGALFQYSKRAVCPQLLSAVI